MKDDVHNPFEDEDLRLQPEAPPANPYQSPMTDTMAQMEKDVSKFVLASRGKRFVNFIIDNIVLRVVGGGIGFVLGMAYGLMLVQNGQELTPEIEFYLNIFGIVLGIAIALIYFITLESMFQMSVGKMVTQTKVVREDGSRPSTGQIIGRAFARFIPFEAFSFLGDDRPIGWHDQLTGTRVIEK